MTWYTGPIQQYLLAPILALFGYRVTVLRSLTVINSLVFVVFYFIAAKRLFGGFVAGLSVLVLVTLPAFTAYGRLAYEVFALNPLLAAGAVVLLLEARHRTGYMRAVLWLFSGGCLGLGTWNHLIFAAVPVALLTVAFWEHRFSLFRMPALYVVYYGFLLALAPKLISVLVSEDLSNGNLAGGVSGEFLPKLLQRLKEWPGLLVQMVHGYPIFQRFTGEVRFRSPDLILPILLAGLAMRLRRKVTWGKQGKKLLLFGVIIFLTTLVLCPKNSDRYFLLILYVMPLIVACALNEFFQFALVGGEKSAFSLWPKGVIWLALCAFVSLQLVRTACNYFAIQISTHGLVSEYRFGSKPETSSNYIRTDRLYDQLEALGARRVYAEFFIAMPLRFYDLKQGRFGSVSIVDSYSSVPQSDKLREGDYAVTYVGGLRRVKSEDYREFVEVFRDEHFVIMKPRESRSLR